MAGSELFRVGGGSDEPGKERSFLDEWFPARNVPVHILVRGVGGAWLAAEQNDDGIGLGWDKAKQKGILRSAIVAFQHRVSKG